MQWLEFTHNNYEFTAMAILCENERNLVHGDFSGFLRKQGRKFTTPLNESYFTLPAPPSQLLVDSNTRIEWDAINHKIIISALIINWNSNWEVSELDLSATSIDDDNPTDVTKILSFLDTSDNVTDEGHFYQKVIRWERRMNYNEVIADQTSSWQLLFRSKIILEYIILEDAIEKIVRVAQNYVA
jgi:hypothetical protein